MSAAFHNSIADQPHPSRTQAILKAHPEVRRLMGRNPWTAVVLLAVLVLQLALAAVMGWLGVDYWWFALLVAYVVGAFANHTLYVIVHEATHHLIFANRTVNRLVAIVCDLPNILPSAMGFRVCHLQHHAHQGVYERDVDVASAWEARVIGRKWYGKALWLLLFPFFQILRTLRVTGFTVLNAWTALNIVTALAFDVAVVSWLGWNGLIYLMASMMFSIGLHPLGGRWIQEHFTFEGGQETFSYYGPLNFLALNVGYHNEHHDFPSIPWNRLPELRRMAPDFYDTLQTRSSWTLLLFQFIFDERFSLFSRVVRRHSA